MGNYRGVGDIKFVPNLPKDKLESMLVNSEAFKRDKELAAIWNQIKDKVYSLNKNELALGLPPNGVTTFYSKNCTEEDAKVSKQFMESVNIEAHNTRLFKDNEINRYEIRMASVLTDDYLRTHDFNGIKFVLSRGDFSPILKIVNKYLSEAENNARNSTEQSVIQEFIAHFQTGHLVLHKEGSKHWIKDKGPTVEFYMGLINRYRDPVGMRGQYVAFVAIVNKELSKKFGTLVSNAPSLLALLPWPNTFEKEQFLTPDFTSLDVLTFSACVIPSGMNLPDYNEIRQNHGFKNLTLGNVISAQLKEKDPNFLCANDKELLDKYQFQSFEVQVGIHELLGHGSGKLLIVANDKPNFDFDSTINPLTNERVNQWYKNGQTYESVFTSLANPWEECRAECVGLYLSLEQKVLDFFGLTGAEAQDVVYVNWLDMIHNGVEALKMYNPSVQKWLQAHAQARYVITRFLLESAPQLVAIKYIEKSEKDAKPDLLITMNKDMNLLQTKGKEAIGALLLKLQVFKSLADIKSAQKLFDKYSEVSDHLEYPYLKYRDVVIDRKKPRKMFVQSSTELTPGGKVSLKTYPSTHEGLIQSFVDHFKGEDIDHIIIDLWNKDCKHFI